MGIAGHVAACNAWDCVRACGLGRCGLATTVGRVWLLRVLVRRKDTSKVPFGALLFLH